MLLCAVAPFTFARRDGEPPLAAIRGRRNLLAELVLLVGCVLADAHHLRLVLAVTVLQDCRFMLVQRQEKIETRLKTSHVRLMRTMMTFSSLPA